MFSRSLQEVPDSVKAVCALSGLKVGASVDIRSGFDVMTSKGRRIMEISPSWHQSVDHGQICSGLGKAEAPHADG